ncbi:Aste57867_16502 [Aphanomyces stellatus]|uniref:Aste57867_16502 protein n=1 Tax=Aphanomyces stellatus TaxID=120398 RepID=A0A485L6U2_9STRA|nr:hypothetical protein As57867_016445 [Aphanomyces stellatus]VFT93276.1 Aste57867_16502 [Aphanomyces stellatus]
MFSSRHIARSLTRSTRHGHCAGAHRWKHSKGRGGKNGNGNNEPQTPREAACENCAAFINLPKRMQRVMTEVILEVEDDLKHSWNRMLAVQTVTHNRVRQSAYVLAQLGPAIRVGPNVGGKRCVQTTFPILGGSMEAHVRISATIDDHRRLRFSKFLYVNVETGEAVNFIRPADLLTAVNLDADFNEIKTPPFSDH